MREKVENMAAAVLAGGKSSRMSGRNKALIEIDGISILRRTIRLLEGIFEEIILVTNSPQDFSAYEKDAIITQDIIKDAGPLAGIQAALARTSQEAVFFTGCDMPFLQNDVIRSQVDYFKQIDCDCLIAKIGPSIEPLHAVYKKRLADDIHGFLTQSSDHSVRGFLKDRARVAYFELEDNAFYRKMLRNLNTPQDLANIDARPCGPSGLFTKMWESLQGKGH